MRGKLLLAIGVAVAAYVACKGTAFDGWRVRLIREARAISQMIDVTPGKSGTTAKDRDTLLAFGGAKVEVGRRDLHVRYDLNPAKELFFVHVPGNYQANDGWGAIVFVHSGDDMRSVPAGWGTVLAERKLIFVAPQEAGNSQRVDRRLGLAVLGAMKAVVKYGLDPGRVYAAGYSGGSRVAGTLGFYHGEIFKGTIQSCGTNYPGAVPMLRGKAEKDGSVYGGMTATSTQIEAAKKGVRFVLITGGGDFRHGNILDIYEGGYEKAGYQALLLDEPKMGHAICDGAALGEGLDFIEGG